MKYFSSLCFCLLFLWCVTAQAADIKSMVETIKQPMTIKASKSKRMDVVFNHTSHRGINCFLCHHKASDKGRYVSCKECHTKPGARERDPQSMFMAFHSKSSDHSCLKCHSDKAANRPDRFGKTFRNCRPCHGTPAAPASK
ncbi:MAG: cytochrome c3 family protein [Desulfovibrio sp.]|nr:cytochrome c3 family protein [Desulfovibrio sp.]